VTTKIGYYESVLVSREKCRRQKDRHQATGIEVRRCGAMTDLRLYAFQPILQNMKIGRRGQVTIPKDLRERFGLKPETEVELQVASNSILLRKKPGKLNLTRWKGRCRKSFKELGYTRVDEFIEDVRGR
jgi:AbrB family looped-hinge helix DNA binding protein